MDTGTQPVGTLRAQAAMLISNYAAASRWSFARQVVLQCLDTTWAQASTAQRIAMLSKPLAGHALTVRTVEMQLARMRKAGLLRTNVVDGVRRWELNLPV